MITLDALEAESNRRFISAISFCNLAFSASDFLNFFLLSSKTLDFVSSLFFIEIIDCCIFW